MSAMHEKEGAAEAYLSRCLAQIMQQMKSDNHWDATHRHGMQCQQAAAAALACMLALESLQEHNECMEEPDYMQCMQ